MHIQKIQSNIYSAFDSQLMPPFLQYLRVPNQSPEFDPNWESNGYAEKATHIIVDFYKSLDLKGATIQVAKHPKRTHFIFIQIQGVTDDAILYYAHYDKQPPMDQSKWTQGKPHEPAIIDGKLFARGAVDDGYGCFIIGLAIQALQNAHISHSRIVLLFESSEESGSTDFEFYAKMFEKDIGDVKFGICMDEGGFDYDHLWNTTSVRGNTNIMLNVKYFKIGVHSGLSGMTTDAFNICRILLDRIQNAQTGEIIKELCCEIAKQKVEEYTKAAENIGNKIYGLIPMLEGTKPYQDKDFTKMLLDITYKTTLTVTGVDGLPSIQNAGNVISPEICLKLSFRFPPKMDVQIAENVLKKVILSDPPYGAKISMQIECSDSGAETPPYPDWLVQSMNSSSQYYFKNDYLSVGDGSTIPFLSWFSRKYPDACFWVTGVGGPDTNSHSIDEMLPLEYTKKMTCILANVIADHFLGINKKPP